MPKPLDKKLIPWHQRPFVTIQEASEILCCSQSKVYALVTEHKLRARKLISGRIGVETADIEAVLGVPPHREQKRALAR